MAEIKGIKMNGEVLTTFNTTGGGHTYVVSINIGISTTILYITINSDKDVALNTVIKKADFLTTFNILPYEFLDAVGNSYYESKSYPAVAAYFDGKGDLYTFTTYGNYGWIKDTRNNSLTVIGKR